ncbi:MAG: metallophosphoesterase [Pseudomonadota bacterium]|nr:metallophosphoesterase [Pseudomonadota bacterium]
MSIKIAHVSDIHVRKLKYHKEYRAVFEQLYEKLREEKPDIIVNTGDTFHTKLDMSPEAIRMMSELFVGLADIAPYHMILGNHDMNLKNSGRLDAISPIVDYLDHPNIHFHKYASVVEVADGIDLHVLSIVDPENWQKDLPKDRVNIALYHGSVVGSVTDSGWMMTHGDISLDELEKYDYAMLGDIHKTDQKVDSDGRARYPGSLVQQNHGESNDKGYLIWNIEDKNTWSTRHVSLVNPKPFITIELTRKGRMPKNISIPNGARLRLVSNNNLPLDTMKRAVDIAKHRFKPESISFLNRASGERGSVDGITDGLQTENLRDIKVQEELIDEYLVDYEASSETIEKVYELNKKYNQIVEDNEDVSRNINWKLIDFEFDNLFNYGEDNNVNFNELSGIIGIFGKNFSGKSSIIDGVLWTLFNTTSKNERKNLNVINQNKDDCRGKVTIQINDLIYTVERTAKKYTKRLKGEETLEAKTELNFEVYDPVMGETTSLNGLTRTLTDANIRKKFGTLDDFAVSSLSSQHGALAFIDEGSTRRKEIIAKFLDLELFDRKFKLAKEDSVDLKGALKRLESKNYDEDLEQTVALLNDAKTKMSEHKETCQTLKNLQAELIDIKDEVQGKIDSIPAEIIDISTVNNQIRSKENEITHLNLENHKLKENLKSKQDSYEKIVSFLDEFDLQKFEQLQQQIDQYKSKLTTQEDNIDKLIEEHNGILKKEKLLHEHEYDPDCEYCSNNEFVKEAQAAVNRKASVEAQQSDTLQTINIITEEIKSLNPNDVEIQLERYSKIESNKHTVSSEIADLNLEIERNKNSVLFLEDKLKELCIKRDEYEENKEAIENLETLVTQLNKCHYKIEQTQNKIDACDEVTLELVKSVGSYEQKIETIKEQKQEYLDLQTEFAAYHLFMVCMHPNGIAYDVIKKKIPVINEEIAKVLANIVDFEVFFEASGNKFDISIKHPCYDERPIEMASGAEKSLSAMAIRLALLGVSSLPKSDLFILDEPGTALDEDNMSGFIQILELIKVYFKNVLLISHLDSLKDCVDMQIVIDKKAGYAKVNQ